MSQRCAHKLARLQAIVAERTAWADPLAQVKRLHGWLLEVEHLLELIEDSAIALHIGDEVRVPFLRGARRKHDFDLAWGCAGYI